MSHEILNSNPYTYLDDAPLEERRARAVMLRRTDPDLAGGIGAPRCGRDRRGTPHRVAGRTRRRRAARRALVARRGGGRRGRRRRAGRRSPDELLAAGRATWAHAGDQRWLVAAERVHRARLVLSDARFAPAVADVAPASARDGSEEEALASVAGGWLESLGPVTVAELARRLGLAPRRMEIGLAGLERSGVALRGRFTPGVTEEEWCERRLLARVHRMTLGILRREIEPVSRPT
jgi:ATP-dependent Lhr-like helicase